VRGVDWIRLSQDRDQWRAPTFGSIKDGEFLDELSDCQLLKKVQWPCRHMDIWIFPVQHYEVLVLVCISYCVCIFSSLTILSEVLML
jgi:hypothetical protein